MTGNKFKNKLEIRHKANDIKNGIKANLKFYEENKLTIQDLLEHLKEFQQIAEEIEMLTMDIDEINFRNKKGL